MKPIKVYKTKPVLGLAALTALFGALAIVGDIGTFELASWSLPLIIKVETIYFCISSATILAEFFLFLLLGFLYCFSNASEKIRVTLIAVTIAAVTVLLNGLTNPSFALLWIALSLPVLGYPAGLFIGKKIFEKHYY